MKMKEIIRIAQKFIDNENLVHPFDSHLEYYLDPAPKDLGLYWYFDYLIRPKIDAPKRGKLDFGGASGFTVSKITHKVEMIAHGCYPDLEAGKKRFDEIENLLRTSGNIWQELRKKTGLTASQAMNLRRRIGALDLDVEKNRLLIIEEIMERIEGNNG
ncbi:hypothetical protein [Flavilitoribacter nigricans]|uniref:Uncharacterized protein n=1 Tax=Flavilitoribacter nigricans (strain ATCC 23147 / DSM 23189 / NBRC 102662 / NCIMB 1420 / SS-2) TaxID=1122177 RepID=A0A2D0N228_FLAN2|nr:hypothetical protein [Flavilitoribacter nigricans]PHN02507.1 hypothetical protein CRP01_31515 [Flavilitoribacter nigricans DSM 23189 = NBRC 102662]